MYILEEMDKFLERYHLPRLVCLYIFPFVPGAVIRNEMENVVKNFPTKVQDQMASQVNSIKYLEKR